MGVQGLTPFLAKICPDVLKELPNGIKAISGKTVVIDATLLTQRFHFGGWMTTNRHVVGWYKFITNLRASNVNAICVFDGKERNLAKARELQRRRENRATSVARENLEVERLDRLLSLQKLVRKVRTLPLKQRGVIVNALRPFVEVETPPPPVLDTKQSDKERIVEELEPTIKQSMLGLEEPLASMEISQPEVEPKIESVELPPSLESPADQVSPEQARKTEVPAKKLASKLIDSYKRYNDSLPNFAKLQIAISTVPLTLSAAPSPAPSEQIDPEPEFYAAASRHQYQLALQEGQAWTTLVEGQRNSAEDAEDEFQDLQERSQILTETYQRRNEFPTSQTYEDAKSLLVPMGVPCLQSEAPYEGEGLASAIVLAGYADFVVSEDTDVIVYGAPLLRYMTDKKRPLLEIDGREVREALSLPGESFVDFALLLGTDFTPRLRNVGPVRALKFIREHGSIEEIVKAETKYPPQFDLPEYLTQVMLGREIFRSLPPLPSPERLKQLPVDELGVQAVMQGFGLSKEMLAKGEDFFTVALKGNYFGDNPL